MRQNAPFPPAPCWIKVTLSGGALRIVFHRRRLLGGAVALAAASAFKPGQAIANTLQRRLAVLNLHTGERVQAVYWDAGAYVQDALAQFDKVLRDHRTGEVHRIAPELLDLAVTLSDRLDARETVQIISGYRSPTTNAVLHKASSGVATKSLHMEGKALDIRLPGVDLARVRDAAWALQKGGVGYYAGSNFVHIDIGRVRCWRG